jgi:aromatic ring hydroxylase
VDCQIFARAKRLLGRTIGSQDLNSAQRRMKDNWAPTAKARDALEGSTTAPVPAAYDFEEQVRDMRAYLRRVGGVHDPEQLKSMRGFNGCSGMLMVLRTVFEKTRWELLHEAALLLDNCVKLLGQTTQSN